MPTSQLVLIFILIFSRVGSCLMVAPGLSSSQIPTQIRLFIAVSVSMTLTPLMLVDDVAQSLSDAPLAFVRNMVFESLLGIVIGLVSRAFFFALETLLVGAATMLGMANPFGIQVEAGETLPPLASVLAMSALALVFFTGLHLELIKGVALSYQMAPIGSGFDTGLALQRLSSAFSDTLRVALRVCSPFFLYAMITNLAAAIINRLTPQISIFYIATPFVIAGGGVLLYFCADKLLQEFIAAFASGLAMN